MNKTGKLATDAINKSARVYATAFTKKPAINWPTFIFLAIAHILAVSALFFWSWPGVITTLVLFWVSGSLGIGMGWHRLLTHRGYKVPKVVEYFLVLCGSFALEGGPIQWVTTHRIHHANTDTVGDPHTPRDGTYWAHLGWILTPTQEVMDQSLYQRYAPDLMNQRFYRWLNKVYWMPLLILGIGLYAFGGWRVMLWGIFFRVTVGLHVTWLVNSATHLWGKRRFVTRDDSTNNWWVALLTFGEGWHNNHHAHPRSAKHGLRWYEIDVNWYGIRALKFLGLAKGIKVVSNDQIMLADNREELREAA
ncbi:MAG TPA: fatty acid desaturase [Pyrinomonadaceae bacterium]|nr:fatty acid desaturase [Pyrinomonadaceae bacterium]